MDTEANPSAIVTVIGAILFIIGGIGIFVWFRTADNADTELDSNDAIDEAADDTVDETETFMRRVERLSRKELDKPDDIHRKR
jgi:hypothetical protein